MRLAKGYTFLEFTFHFQLEQECSLLLNEGLGQKKNIVFFNLRKFLSKEDIPFYFTKFSKSSNLISY